MGQDKALIQLQGVPLLRQVCEVALNCTNKVYVVTPWPERYQTILPNACQVIREVPLREATKNGPLVAFVQGLAHVETEWALLLACDLPRLRRDVLQQWTSKLATTKSDAIALLPRHAKGWEPLCGFYRRQSLPLLRQFIDQGGDHFSTGWHNTQFKNYQSAIPNCCLIAIHLLTWM